MSVQEHKQAKPSSVTCKVITISDTRTKETDKSGQLMITLLEENGYKVLEHVIVKDEETYIEKAIREGCEQEG